MSGTSPHTPHLRVPASGDDATMPPPPPRASARFPDAPPTAGLAESGGSPRRQPAGQPAPDGIPPRQAERPSTPRRTGAPAETAAETTFRLRPILADPSPESDTRPPSARGSADVPSRPGGAPMPGSIGVPPQAGSSTAQGASGAPPRPGGGPAQGSTAMPPPPATRPGPAPADPTRRTASAPPPPRPAVSVPLPPEREPGTGHAPAGSGYGAAAPPGPAPAHVPGQSTNGHGSASFAPDPSLSWSAPMAPGGAPGAGRPHVSFGEPEGYDERARPRPLLGVRIRPRLAAAAACVVLGLGLIGGAVTGSWLVGESGDGGAQDTFAAAGGLWHSVPVDQLFPRTVLGKGAGPGGADRTWTRIAVAPDSGCANAFDPLLRKALAPVGCERLLRATYIDATESYVTTVGLVFTTADAAAMRSLDSRFAKEDLDRRADLMPRPYAVKGTLAAGFGDEQRASWTVSVLTDAPVVVYAVSGWADDRTVDEPEPADEAMRSGTTTAVAQAGLGHEAKGLADRVERALRKNVGPTTEQS
ncbi:hypothetical protein [Streptomyces sp. AS02]|uniref:hypothetical protein n=1 Tax=Streptomyces sp. AS02 TaxID=2938946 RepID=UPI0020229071|nr:hypothetical protein [Streptomyces sp. AS02]MCL8012678.1 hypothetical protein [Streptomyces sp. AS02]